MKLSYTVGKEENSRLVKSILKSRLNLSERLIKKLKCEHLISLNGVPVFVNHPVKEGDMIEVLVDLKEECEGIIPENIPIDIIYEDDYMLVLNKQPGIVVHPAASHHSGTIANGIMYYLKNKGTVKKIRPVSRLDRDTSGLIVFAKNQFIQHSLITQMNRKTFTKEYIGIVYGTPENMTGTINMPIDRAPGSIMLRHVTPEGFPSVTHYEVIQSFGNASLMRFILETGRTHQIRVHCQAIGHPIEGDTLYSAYNSPMPRQALHSHKVSFTHPVTCELLECTAPIPKDMADYLKHLSE